jgi:UDP-3-O-[3-hydroxymyristoyl] glucosamine N-acyltransferase
MTDSRFFDRSGPFSAAHIAKRIGAELADGAAGQLMIHDIAALDTAGPTELSVFSEAPYLRSFVETRACAVITSRELACHAANGARLIISAQPRLAFAQAGHLFYPPHALKPGVEASARIDPSAIVGAGLQIDAGAVIGPGVELGARCHVGANVVIGRGVVIGEDCRIGANTVVGHALIGSRVEIATCVSIGGSGFGFVPDPTCLLRTPQLGRVVIEDDVKIDANCAIDRGAHGDTVIGAGTVIDNLVQIAHNVRLGRCCILAGQVGIAGSTVIGDGVVIGGQAAISDHLTIGSGARIAGKSGVVRDVEEGMAVGGCPAIPVRQWHRQTVGLLRLFQHKQALKG